jgi:hypothetical protein
LERSEQVRSQNPKQGATTTAKEVFTMTNAQIIFNASISLMEDGVIKGTGRVFEYTDDAGEVHRLEEPEALHTFAAWKELGRVVKRGEHCKAKIQIWKYCKSKKEEGEDAQADGENGKCYMKTAFFFTYDQTEPVKEKKGA